MRELELFEVDRPHQSDVAQGAVASDDIGRHFPLAGQFHTVVAQCLEKLLRSLVKTLPRAQGRGRGSLGAEFRCVRRWHQEARGALGVDDLAAFLGEDDDRSLAAEEVDPAGGDHASQELHKPLFRMFLE